MAKHVKGEPAHIPSSTYRLQLNHQCTFRQVSGLVDYLCALGIGDCYLSPFLMAAEGSMHGYDVTNPAQFNPEIGTAEEFRTLRERLKQRGLTEKQVQQRVAAQMPLDQKRKMAGVEIDCSGSIEDTQAQVDRAIEKLKLAAAGRNIP